MITNDEIERMWEKAVQNIF